MATQPSNVEKIAADSLVATLSGLLGTISRIPHSSSTQDVAASIAMLGDVEKAVRKLRIVWTAYLVESARQRPLNM